MSKIKLLPFSKITKQNIQQLLKISTDMDTMKYICSGKQIWDEKTILDLMKYSKDDESNKNNRLYYHYAIMKNKKLVGYIGLHPMFSPYKNDLQIRVFLDPDERGHNYSVLAIKKLLKMKKKNIIQKQIWCVSKTTNIPSNKMAFKSGGFFMKTIKIGDEKYNIYSYD